MACEEQGVILEQEISRLPERLRLVFQLRGIEGFSTQETAEILGISKNLVKERLHRAWLALRESLSPYLAERQTSRGWEVKQWNVKK